MALISRASLHMADSHSRQEMAAHVLHSRPVREQATPSPIGHAGALTAPCPRAAQAQDLYYDYATIYKQRPILPLLRRILHGATIWHAGMIFAARETREQDELRRRRQHFTSRRRRR